MGTTINYYIDAGSFEDATSVYTDATMQTYAADGWYQKDGVVRQLTSGVLGPVSACVSCSIGCSTTTITHIDDGSKYSIIEVDLGATTGSVIIEFTPGDDPKSILAYWDDGFGSSPWFNDVISPTYGALFQTLAKRETQSSTFLGKTANDCGISGSNYNLDRDQFINGAWYDLDTQESISVHADQVQLTALAPGTCIMSIPKSQAQSIMYVYIESPCGNSQFDIKINCPTALTGFSSNSSPSIDAATACAASTPNTLYNVPVNGSPGVPGLYDYVSSSIDGDMLGPNLPAGFYPSPSGWFELDSNSVVINTGTCPP